MGCRGGSGHVFVAVGVGVLGWRAVGALAVGLAWWDLRVWGMLLLLLLLLRLVLAQSGMRGLRLGFGVDMLGFHCWGGGG